jgi:hypothetical protein
LKDGEPAIVCGLLALTGTLFYLLAVHFIFIFTAGSTLCRSYAVGMVVVLLAHARQDGLLGTVVDRAQLFLGTMRNASTTLDSHFLAIPFIATLAGRSVRAAETSLFHVLVASGVQAALPFGPVRNAQSTLDDAVGAVVDSTLATDTLAGATRGQLGARVARIHRAGSFTGWTCVLGQVLQAVARSNRRVGGLQIAKKVVISALQSNIKILRW